MKRSYTVVYFIIIMITLVLSGCNMSVNKSSHFQDGETVDYGPKSVNGSITVGNKCIVKGSCSTVNGSIDVGFDCEMKGLKTVNSGISVGKNTVIDGDIKTVNGSIECSEKVKVEGEVSCINGSIDCDSGVFVRGKISNINGDIDLINTIVKEDISTHNGNISLSQNSLVEGDIIIKDSHNSRRHRLTITLSGNSTVKGDIIVKNEDVDVTVYLSKGCKIEGKVEGAAVVEK
jgi:hypothetical protein